MRASILLGLALAASPAAAQWTNGPPLPEARTGAAVAAFGGYIYVIGGRNSSGYPLDTALRYDPSTGQWAPAGTLDHGRADGAAVILNDRLMVTGGRREDGNVLDDVEEYVPGSNSWFTNSECTHEREGHVAVAIGANAYTLGGTSEGGSYLADSEWWEYGLPFWQSYAPWLLPVPRATFAAAPAGEGVIVAGGFSTFGPLSDVDYFVPGSPGVSRAPLPTARGGVGGATIDTPEGQRIFVAGGRDASNAVVTTVDVYDPVANSWAPGTSLPAPRERASVVALGGRLYVIGGRDAGGTPTATMFVLDVATAAEDGPDGARALALTAPSPNPTAGSANFRLTAMNAGPATIDVLDALGRRVAVLLDGPLAVGEHELAWDGVDAAGRRVPGGVYFVRVRQGSASAVRALTIAR